MTTYSYNIDLTEMELIAVEAAIKSYIEECDRKIAAGDIALAAHHKDRLLDVMANDTRMPPRHLETTLEEVVPRLILMIGFSTTKMATR